MISVLMLGKKFEAVIAISVLFGLTFFLLSLVSTPAGGEDGDWLRTALIIVSSTSNDTLEEQKALSFHDHLIGQGYSNDSIIFLADEELPGSDGRSNCSNIESSFDLISQVQDPDGEVVIMISDHEQGVRGNSSFVFEDGVIPSSTIGSWMDDIECSSMTVILNGNRSGLAFWELSSSTRELISSMRWDQVIDGNGIVSYHEAYLKECYNLRFSDQDPQYFSG